MGGFISRRGHGAQIVRSQYSCRRSSCRASRRRDEPKHIYHLIRGSEAYRPAGYPCSGPSSRKYRARKLFFAVGRVPLGGIEPAGITG